MKIPKRFKVFASTINVDFDSERLSNEGFLGIVTSMIIK